METLFVGDPYAPKPRRSKNENREVKCKFCGNEARIVGGDGRYMVMCMACGADTYLKTYQQPKTRPV